MRTEMQQREEDVERQADMKQRLRMDSNGGKVRTEEEI